MKNSVRKIIICGLTLIMCLALIGGCGKKKGDDVPADVDLTKLSYVVAYAEAGKMKETPQEYVGKTVKTNGKMAIYDYSSLSPDKKNMFCVSNLDNTGCCQITMEFILEGGSLDPADYPKLDEDVVVCGTFDTYEIKGFTYCYLKDAKVW